VQFTLSFNADVIPPQARVEVEVATDSAFNNSWDRQEVREWRSGQVIIGVPSATTSEGYVRLRLLHPDGQLACTGDETRVTIPEATP
jgi:NAD kinase